MSQINVTLEEFVETLTAMHAAKWGHPDPARRFALPTLAPAYLDPTLAEELDAVARRIREEEPPAHHTPTFKMRRWSTGAE